MVLKKTKILVEAHVFDGEYQGTRTFLKGIYTAIAENNADIVQVYFISADNKSIKNEFSGLNIIFLKYFFKNKLFRYYLEIPFWVFRHKIDYCHFQYISPLIPYSKFIVTIHDILFKDFPQYFPVIYSKSRNIFFYLAAKSANILTTVSEYSASQIAYHYKIDINKIVITPCAVKFENKEFSKNLNYIQSKYNIEKYILCVSRIEPRKNQASILKSYLELNLHLKSIYLVFIGKKSLHDFRFTSLLESIPQDIIKFIKIFDNIDNHDLEHFYNCCEVFIFPSFAEGFGIPPLEAALKNKNVICSNQTAMKEYSFFGKGFFNPNIDGELTSILEMFLNEGEENNIELNYIKNQVLKTYNWSYSANNLLNSLKK